MLSIHQNKEILQNFIQNKILNFTYNLSELKKIAKENHLPNIEKILSKKI